MGVAPELEDEIEYLERQGDKQRARIATLFDAIAHGDEKHRAWLKQAIKDHFAGRPVQPPT